MMSNAYGKCAYALQEPNSWPHSSSVRTLKVPKCLNA
jgi:hypothetical protein